MLNHHSAGALGSEPPLHPAYAGQDLTFHPLTTGTNTPQGTAIRTIEPSIISDKPETNDHSLSGGNVKYEPQNPVVPTSDKPNTTGHSLGGDIKDEPKNPVVPPTVPPTDNPPTNPGSPTPENPNDQPPKNDGDSYVAKAELFWHHGKLGIGTAWYIDNGTELVGAQSLVYGAGVGDSRVGTAVEWGSSWKLSGAADFNGDGIQDHLYDNGVDILIATLGQLNGQTATLESAIAPTLNGQRAVIPNGWKLIGAPDMNGDGIGDLLFHSATEDATAIWHLDSQHQVTQAVFVRNATGEIAHTTPAGQSSPWTVDGWGDFDGDGDTDLLYHWEATGQTAIWRMDGHTVEGTVLVNAVTSTGVSLSVGDFNGDGIDDTVTRNPLTNETKIWTFDHNAIATETVLVTADIGWEIKAIADMDGDGTDDLVWEHKGLDISAIWIMRDGQRSPDSHWIHDFRTGSDQSRVHTGDAHWEIKATVDHPQLTA
ncbi:VCBS repeat-containing protein [filamentous cyanobacterium LEGE 11480]|uniref:VCBS repeat-containing protein n=1 Tax=Romeriopsis navalis LEGE 11480 TaxID=2777977 RepID=A0A928VSJ5_9CYAN|nr:VCBS repeat-containing protein [Romeriopsis navalis]MBE9032967.1 VCBS repeat-containing protein [Romeriopsis navalis LEGE 11480]